MKDVLDRVGPALYPAVALVLAFVFTTAVGWAFPSPTPQPVPAPTPPADATTSLVVVGEPAVPLRALRWAYPEPKEPAPGALDPAWQPLPPPSGGPRWRATTSLTDHQICVEAPRGSALEIVTPLTQPAAPAPSGVVCLGPWVAPTEQPDSIVLDLTTEAPR